ncbi:MAG: aromatic amino acid hydroxylase [Bdellovibrionaceae bacterium]|nr:aromatic amino acid hydroxylase [Pseudobdellovibrionaceae bacterium]
MSFQLPSHLRKYVVRQEDRSYTPVDHAVWRFCLRQLRAYLSKNAHESYLDGLSKTGIEVERIPRIADVSEKLAHFGWRALPVSGFIPPAAFMELQALNVLPVASDIRSLDHLTYTPAPDIVHEAAGHAPMLANTEFADYLRQYAQVAKKALISKEDMDVYEAIRDLSDLKENPASTEQEIKAAEERLVRVSESSTHISEATWLSRMNWWTAEYGLIGSLEKPRIYGAGLLSSVGESKLCLSDKVKKIPMSIDCIEYGYDITEPQPQLFVTPDFKTLGVVLNELADRMAFREGGRVSIEKAIQAKTVNTVELNSGLQISGICTEILPAQGTEIAYLRFEGPSQLSMTDRQLEGHGKDDHAHGFGTAVGFLKAHPGKCPSTLSDEDWETLGAKPGQTLTLEYTSGVKVVGAFKSRMVKDGKTVLLALENATATLDGRVLFDPSWGTYDLAIGSSVPSVFGGPADRLAFGEVDDFIAKRVPTPVFSEQEKKRHQLYERVRDWREKQVKGDVLEQNLATALDEATRDFPEDWLIVLEMHELALNRASESGIAQNIRKSLEQRINVQPDQAEIIREGLALANQMS